MKLNKIFSVTAALCLWVCNSSSPMTFNTRAEALDNTDACGTYDKLSYKRFDDNGDGAYDCIKLTDCYMAAVSVNIPDEIEGLPVIAIGNETFMDCQKLRTVNIPDSVTVIGESAFSGCLSLERIVIPDSVNAMGDEVFSECESLKKINVPDGVTSLSRCAFYGCTSLESVRLSDKISYINGGAFSRCSSLKVIEIPNGITSIEDSTFFGCTSLRRIKIPNSVTSIGDYTFYNCTSLGSIEIPDSVTVIGENAFNGCLSLENIEIPDSVTSIGVHAFDGTFVHQYENGIVYADKWIVCGSDENIETAEIRTDTKGISDYAFHCHTNLISVSVPSSVDFIGDWAFVGCENLESITILNPDCKIGSRSQTLAPTATIYGYEGSTAQAYAERYKHDFVALYTDAPAETETYVEPTEAAPAVTHVVTATAAAAVTTTVTTTATTTAETTSAAVSETTTTTSAASNCGCGKCTGNCTASVTTTTVTTTATTTAETTSAAVSETTTTTAVNNCGCGKCTGSCAQKSLKKE